MSKNYEIKIGQFKPLEYFSKNKMLAYQTSCNDNFYDCFAGKSCNFAVFDSGEVFHESTKIQVNPSDIFWGCKYCSDNIPLLSTKSLEVVIEGGEMIMFNPDKNEGLDVEGRIDIEFCPVCGRKLKLDDFEK